MSSLELATYYGGRHNDCIASVRNMLGQCGIDPTQFMSTERDINGLLRTILTLPKELVLLCITGWSTTALAKVVDRYMQLKATDLIEMAKAVENFLWYNGATPVYMRNPVRNASMLQPAEVTSRMSRKYGNAIDVYLSN
jgi:hypothetical protein